MRHPVVLILCSILCAGVVGGIASESAASGNQTDGAIDAHADQAGPNIVFILVDDLGWGDLSCYGQTNWTTPRLDAMAREGMRFTDAYAGNTVCAPSRATLLTGQHPGRVFQRGNGPVAFRRDPHDITIATRLRSLGYATAMIGKSGVACNSADAALPHDKGFDHFYGVLSHVVAHRNYPREIVRNGEIITLPGNSGYTGDTYANELWVDDAVSWIGAHKDGPFFLHLSLTPPHADLTVPERYMAPFRGKFDEVPHSKGGYFPQPEPRAAYAGMISFVDESVGRVLDALRAHGVDEDTVVFFASDNGPHFEGGTNPEVFDSNGPLRGGKRDMTEGGLRTPQIAWWPGTIAPGTTTDVVTAFWDFPATALDLAGAALSTNSLETNSLETGRIEFDQAGMDGISIAPTLLGTPEAQEAREYLYWEFHEQGGKQAVRMGDWKGIRLGVDADRDAPIALYDLREDLGETRDVSAAHPEVVARIARAMDEAHTPSDLFPFGRTPASVSRSKGQRRLSNSHDDLVLDRAGFSVLHTSSASEFNGMTGAMAIDATPGGGANLETKWHTAWKDAKPPHPHTITIDLGGTHAVHGLRVMARQDGTDNGTVRRLQVFVSDEAPTASDPARAYMPNMPNTPPAADAALGFTKDEQEIMLPEPAMGRYVTIVTRSAHAGSPFACFSNIEILGRIR